MSGCTDLEASDKILLVRNDDPRLGNGGSDAIQRFMAEVGSTIELASVDGGVVLATKLFSSMSELEAKKFAEELRTGTARSSTDAAVGSRETPADNPVNPTCSYRSVSTRPPARQSAATQWSEDDTPKMSLLEMGLKIQDLLDRYGVQSESQLKITKGILDVFDYWQNSKNNATFRLDSSSEASYSDESDVVDAETQTEAVPKAAPSKGTNTQDKKSVEILSNLLSGKEKHRNLESLVEPEKAVELRRKFIEHDANVSMQKLPFENYNYKQVIGACCENVIGYVPLPVGIAGPLKMDNELVYVPMATCEGALVASTNRGCRATESGITTVIVDDKMTRAPVIKFETVTEALAFKRWFEEPDNYAMIKSEFESTSRFAKLVHTRVDLVGLEVHIRFCAQTGDAMGMNMISKAVEKAMHAIDTKLHKFKYITISGNRCADKKASAINWIEGRGKSVIAQTIIRKENVRKVLKTSVKEMVDLGNTKLMAGTSSGITIGGWNAHAANIVAAIFLATGQDAAQVVSSHMCMTQMEETAKGDLSITCTMNCVEVGTVGGGTILEAQRNNLEILKCAGAHPTNPGQNAQKLARVIASAVLAGEISLLASQCAKDLVQTHLKLNRSVQSLQSLPRISEEPVRELAAPITVSAPPTPGSKLDRVYKHTMPVNCSSTF